MRHETKGVGLSEGIGAPVIRYVCKTAVAVFLFFVLFPGGFEFFCETSAA